MSFSFNYLYNSELVILSRYFYPRKIKV